MKNYNLIRAENNELQKLQKFKKPFTDFVNTIVYSGEETDEDMCEFFLLQDSEKEFEKLDIEIEKTALKLARLLELKEQELKNAIINML